MGKQRRGRRRGGALHHLHADDLHGQRLRRPARHPVMAAADRRHGAGRLCDPVERRLHQLRSRQRRHHHRESPALPAVRRLAAIQHAVPQVVGGRSAAARLLQSPDPDRRVEFSDAGQQQLQHRNRHHRHDQSGGDLGRELLPGRARSYHPGQSRQRLRRRRLPRARRYNPARPRRSATGWCVAIRLPRLRLATCTSCSPTSRTTSA